ncbi:MAG: YafY family transcriptional regulator [Actinomycetota bacterium]|jgi:proteasome accessory factor C|nr:YafY family transcriptional regulator [Actinomycetota bacterium]
MEGVAERLPRLLALVPYLLVRPGVPIEEVAADFSITVRQLRRDLELLWMCGLPGYGPGDLIDLSFEGDTVTVTFDAGIRRPLRLSRAEATALVVALRALADTPGLADTGSVRRALAKIEAAAGQTDGVVLGLATREEAALTTVRDALDHRCALRIRYYTPSRDTISERIVDPMRLLLVEGRSYLEAWCRVAEEVRLFRLDRIEHVTTLDQPAQPPPHARPADVSAGLFRPRPDQRTAVLTLAPDARWVAEYYPVDELIEGEGGTATVRMRYAETDWMVRLVLGLGADVIVRDPPELAEAVTQRALEALQRSSAAAPDQTD